jgi:hypothetical protein
MGVGVASSGSGGQGFAFKLEGDGDSKIGNSSGDLHQFTGSVAMNENVFFLTNGRVGIGTDAPDYKLDVAGNIGLNQYIYHNGDANTKINFTDDRIQILLLIKSPLIMGLTMLILLLRTILTIKLYQSMLVLQD